MLRMIVHARTWPATDTRPGLARHATQAEVDTGEDTATTVTPATLRGRDHAPWAEAAGSVSVASSGLTAVAFPAGMFTETPIVAVTKVTGANVAVPHITDLDAEGMNVRLYTLGGAQTSGNAHWIAVQMEGS